MTKRLTLTGCPLSVNNIWRRNNKGWTYLTDAGRNLKEKWAWEARTQWKMEPTKEKVSLSLVLYFPDRKRRDLSNQPKLIEDALTGVVWNDDSQIDELIIVRDYDKRLPRVELVIATL